MERNLTYGTAGCFIATIIAIFLTKYTPNAFLLVLVPMWGLVLGVAVARVRDLKR